jgi:hypothetical protein
MKTKLSPVILLYATLLASLALIGCSAFKTGQTPNGVNEALFTPQTNYVTVQIPVTNADHTITTNSVQKPVYSYGPGPGEQQIKDIGTAVGTPFGVGGLVGGALGLVFGAWRWAISNKTGAAGATLAQEMETALEFMSTLPNGGVIRAQFTNWLQAHQAQTDTLQQVLDYIENTVKNDNAQVAAQQISSVVQTLTQGPTPPAATKA